MVRLGWFRVEGKARAGQDAGQQVGPVLYYMLLGRLNDRGELEFLAARSPRLNTVNLASPRSYGKPRCVNRRLASRKVEACREQYDQRWQVDTNHLAEGLPTFST